MISFSTYNKILNESLNRYMKEELKNIYDNLDSKSKKIVDKSLNNSFIKQHIDDSTILLLTLVSLDLVSAEYLENIVI